MTAKPVVVAPGESLVDAYNLMFDQEIRRLPVVESGELVGIVTLSDILLALPGRLQDTDLETRLTLADQSVREIMSYDPITVAPEDTIQEAAERMLEYEISGLPVVQDNRVIGMITESDIFAIVVNALSAQPVKEQ